MALTHLTDLLDTAKGRLLNQYRKLIYRFVPELGVLVGQVQEVEDVFWTFFTYLDLDVAPGEWLTRLGGLVGEPREGFTDVPYLRFVKARIIANRTHSQIDDVLRVARTALGSGTFSLVTWYPAAMTLTISAIALGGQTGDAVLTKLVNLLRRTRALCVGFRVRYQDDTDDSHIFVYGDVPGGSDPTGLGFGDAGDPSVGGRYSGAAKA